MQCLAFNVALRVPRASSHGSPSPLTSMHAISAFKSLEVGTLFTWGPKYEMDAYMATFCESETQDLC
jgi:hypothetical protein